jgi:protocatechuate 3,4-dioxygenase beta subunit
MTRSTFSRGSASWTFAGAIGLFATMFLSAQQAARDPNVAAAPLATAVISGTLVTDETTPKPVRRAIVTLANAGGPANAIGGRASSSPAAVSTTVVTDDAGRFVFSALPAGRFSITASKPAFLNASYGAKRPGRPGTPIQLSDGQPLTNLTIRMSRGAVITGTITNQTGEPAPNARVSLMKYVYSSQNGERTLQQSGGSASSDDRGVYRIFGVAPGEYIVQLEVPFALPGELRQTTDQSLQAAVQQLQSGRGSTVSPSPAGATAASVVQGPSVGYAPVYFPGAASPATATFVKVAAGDERTDIDIQIRLVSTAKIEGVVVGPEGQPAPGTQLTMIGSGQSGVSMSAMMSMFGMARPGPDGRFTIPAVAPGTYTIAARSGGIARGAGAGPLAMSPMSGTGSVLWATADVTIDGQDVSNIRLALEPGMNVSGRMAFAGTSPVPKDLSTMRVQLTAVLTGSAVASVIPPGTVNAEGVFTFAGVTPGKYRLSSVAGNPWALKSITTGGHEVIDSSLEVRPGETVTDLVMTFGDQPTELTGTLQDTTGRPAPEYFIIAYASDKALWTAPTRRVAQTRPGSDGKFTLRNLPPGEYLLAAVTDVEPGEWMDPAFLALLVDSSIKVTLAEGEKKTQDLKIASGV